MPPYHPDYDANAPPPSDYDTGTTSSGYESDTLMRPNGQLIRRGSEGFEIGPINREETLHRYVDSLGAQQGRYNIYVPEPPSEPDTSDDDNMPLGERVERWRADADTAYTSDGEKKNQ